MADLQCAARILVARHGEAAYESDLLHDHGGAICTAVPHLALNLAPRFPHGRPLPNCGVVELEADADGWVARSWAGTPLT
jgi:probable phosphoglycerate mutase